MTTKISETTSALQNRVLQLTDHLVQSMEDSARYTRPNMSALGAIGVVALPGYYFLWIALFPESYENFPLRMTACLVAIPALLVDYWPEKWARYLPAYWWLGLTYILPFFFTFMLLQNSQVTMPDDPMTMVWPLSTVVAVAVITMLIQDAMLVVTAWLSGTFAAWCLFLLANDQIVWATVQREYFGPLPVYVFLLIMGAISNRNRKMVQAGMLRAAGSVGASIAHELRTPLLGIRSSAQGLRTYLPDLVRGYRVAQEANLNVPVIRQRHIAALAAAIDHIDHETQYSNQVIDMLLINSGRSRVESSEFRAESARTCVQKALERYPFASEQERARVAFINGNDFRFFGSEILLTHVVFNLLKNALFFVAPTDGQVQIHLESDNTGGRLIFWDNGSGVSPRVLPRIFDSFYTSHEPGRGTGIGLAFCRMVMDGFGGGITCESEHGEYTRFTLNFPLAIDPRSTQ